MAYIPIIGHNLNYPYSSLNTTNHRMVSFLEIFHAAVTYSPRYYGIHYYFDVMRRISTILATLEENNNLFWPTGIYKYSDPTEKVFTSYVLGMTFCNYIALNELGYDYIVHYNLVASTPGFNITRGSFSKSTPDFLGFKHFNKNDYLVIEAKGTSSKFNSEVMIKGKSQVNQISYINGLKPLRVVVQTYFDDNLMVDFEDPESDNGVSIQLNNSEVFNLFLDSIKSFFKAAPQITTKKLLDFEFTGTSIHGTNYFVGILTEVFTSDKINHGRLQEIVNIIREQITTDKVYIGNSGIIITKEN